MASDNKQKSLPRRCTYCNARFNDELRQLLVEDDEPIYCELCGTEVRIHSTQESQTHKKGSKKGRPCSKKKHKKKRSKKKRKQETQHLNPITHIGFDPEFPLIFKENLMLVLSRIIYLAIKKVDDIEALKNSNRDISKELIAQLEHILEPTTWAKIKVNFLGKLYKLTIDQFYEHLKRLQKKIQENEQYREHFIIFLRYIINNTFRIISEMWEAPEIPKFFHVIRKDLKNYGFDAYTKEDHSEEQVIEKNVDNTSEKFIVIEENENVEAQEEFLANPIGFNLNEEKKSIIRNFVINLFGNDPINCYKDIINDENFGSLRSIADRLEISRPTLKSYLSTWFKILYRKKAVNNVFKLFWKENSSKQKEKIIFNELIEKYIRLYPDRIYLIPTRNSLLASELKGIISKNTFRPWVIDYLVQLRFKSQDKAIKIYNEIWGKNCARRRKIKYVDIKDFIHHRSHGKAFLLTSKEDFEQIQGYPTERNISIACGEEHKFSIQVRKLIYDYNWCPYCNEYLCEKFLGSYLGYLFKTSFKSQVSLNEAFCIDKKEEIVKTVEIDGIRYKISIFPGRLRYDHYSASVYLTGKKEVTYRFFVAAEYDGIHHDEENIMQNPFCDSNEEYASIVARDTIKNEISYEKKVILIRLKEKDGFNRRRLQYNQKETMREIISQFKRQIKELFDIEEVELKYDPYIRIDPFGEKEIYRLQGSLDRFL